MSLAKYRKLSKNSWSSLDKPNKEEPNEEQESDNNQEDNSNDV